LFLIEEIAAKQCKRILVFCVDPFFPASQHKHHSKEQQQRQQHQQEWPHSWHVYGLLALSNGHQAWQQHQLMTFMADSLARKIPFVIGAIVVLLVVNTALQYAAGPALQQALPPQEIRNNVRGGAVQEAATYQHGPNHDLITDVAPGGADAELLCADKRTGCDPR
jgi:hypothetical protein